MSVELASSMYTCLSITSNQGVSWKTLICLCIMDHCPDHARRLCLLDVMCDAWSQLLLDRLDRELGMWPAQWLDTALHWMQVQLATEVQSLEVLPADVAQNAHPLRYGLPAA